MTEPTDIVYLASHGFAARMILQTELVRKLTDHGHRVAIVVPDSSDDSIAAQADAQKAQLIQHQHRLSFFESTHWQNRRYFLDDVYGNPCLREKHMVRMRERGRSPLKWLQPRLGAAVLKARRVIPFLANVCRSAEERFIFRSKSVRHLLKELEPRCVISTYPVMPPEPQFLIEAKKLGIETVIHLLSWDNITAKGSFAALADRYIAWGPIMADELQSTYRVQAESIQQCGVPHFDLHARIREELNGARPADALASLNLSQTKPYLFFAMSSPRFAPNEIDVVEWIANAVNEGMFGDQMQLVVRPHPQNLKGFMADESWLPRIEALSSERVAVNTPTMTGSKIPWAMQSSDMHQLSSLIGGASVVLNSGSTVSIDALCHARPVILTSFDAEVEQPYWNSARRLLDYIHLKKFVSLGGVSVASNFEQLAEMINVAVRSPNSNSESRKYAIEQECGICDGGATERVAKSLTTILTDGS